MLERCFENSVYVYIDHYLKLKGNFISTMLEKFFSTEIFYGILFSKFCSKVL